MVSVAILASLSPLPFKERLHDHLTVKAKENKIFMLAQRGRPKPEALRRKKRGLGRREETTTVAKMSVWNCLKKRRREVLSCQTNYPLFYHGISLLVPSLFPPSSFDRTFRVATLVLTAEISPAFSFSRRIRDKYQSLRLPLNPLGPSRASSFSPSLLDLPYVFAVDRLTRVARSHSRDSR